MISEKTKFRFIIAISVIVLVFIFILALTVGRYHISLSTFFQLIKGNKKDYPIEYSVLINLRLPRTIIAGLVGIALSISGLVYQETFQNKLVSPDILGVSSGASVGAALAILLGLSNIAGGIGISLMAFVFGIGTILLTISISQLFKNSSSVTMILSGIIVGGLASSALSLIKSIANTETELPAITYWLLGSFSSSKMIDVWIFLPIVIICTSFIFLIKWKINIIVLGEAEAQTKGTNYKLYRWLIIATATLLTAGAVSVSGVVGWVGLIIPHIVRLIVGRENTKTVPLTILLGAIIMIGVDIVARTLTSVEIPLSAITGVVGALIFIFILLIKKKQANEYE